VDGGRILAKRDRNDRRPSPQNMLPKCLRIPRTEKLIHIS
jgi:hypothetical protein